jgi:hypothetical protein
MNVSGLRIALKSASSQTAAARGEFFDMAQQVIGADIQRDDGDDDRHHFGDPGMGQRGQAELLRQFVHG